MERGAPCTVCNSHEHLSRKCPDLRDVLEEGFDSGGGGGEGHSHDEEDLEPLEVVKPLEILDSPTV